MSGMLAPMGILSGPMSEYFDQPVTEITTRFSWLTMGILIGAIIALVIFDWVRLKRLMMLVYGVIFTSLVSLTFIDDLTLIGLALGLVGVGSGIGMPGAALTITKTYETKQRASMLVITDGCFSVAGIFCSWLAIFLLAREYHWSGVYQFVAFIAALVFIISALSVFPENDAEEPNSGATGRWPLAIWLCVVALFLYTLGTMVDPFVAAKLRRNDTRRSTRTGRTAGQPVLDRNVCRTTIRGLVGHENRRTQTGGDSGRDNHLVFRAPVALRGD